MKRKTIKYDKSKTKKKDDETGKKTYLDFHFRAKIKLPQCVIVLLLLFGYEKWKITLTELFCNRISPLSRKVHGIGGMYASSVSICLLYTQTIYRIVSSTKIYYIVDHFI